MKFNNTVAYCKGFYKARQGGVSEMWKDMAHCINCDGWNVYTRRDVAIWCMNRIEDFAKEFPKDAWQVSFGMFYSKMEHNKEIFKFSNTHKSLGRELDDMDYIIWAYRDFVRYLDGDKFTEGVIPDDIVLPVNMELISVTLWNEITSKYLVQEVGPCTQTYDEIESKIH